MRHLYRHCVTGIASALALLLSSQMAHANFCNDPASAVGLAEADALELEPFSQPLSTEWYDFVGDHEYNARLITCNRKRDTNGNALDAATAATREFPTDLVPKTVKGHYSYMGLGVFSQLRYAYDLSREGGQWIVTLPIEFHWPDVRRPDKVDLPMELAEKLGLDRPGQICAPGSTVLDPTDRRQIVQGFIDWDIDPGMLGVFQADQRAAGIVANSLHASRLAASGSADESTIDNILSTYDVMYYWYEESCRVPRSLVVQDPDTSARRRLSVLNHLREYWAEKLAETWNRDEFELRPRFVNCEAPPAGSISACDSTVSDEEMSAWEKDETIWHVHFNLTPWHRPSYKRWLAKLNNMHTGCSAETVAHEAGHQLGLDDEYGENESSDKHCENVLASAGSEYIMCDADAGRRGAKGVYPWIITRRYEVGRDYQCKEDTDCKAGEYCAVGTFGIGKNSCEPRHAEGESCSREAQCAPAATCHFNPLGMCVTPSSSPMGHSCDRDIQCTSGSCSSAGICQCNDNGDCGANSFCALGTLGIGRNTCEPYHREDESCSRQDQCRPEAQCHFNPFGMCVTADSVPLGGACERDIQCDDGTCDGGRCVCTEDSHCPGNQECKKPLFGTNHCE